MAGFRLNLIRLLAALCISAGLSLSCALAGTVTAKNDLPRGAVISADDLDVEAESHESVDQVLEAYVGKELKRPVYAGYKLNPAYVGTPILVKRNTRVSMVYRMGALEITAWGRALGQGGVGDEITVMNLESRKRVNGVILKSGTVEVRS